MIQSMECCVLWVNKPADSKRKTTWCHETAMIAKAGSCEILFCSLLGEGFNVPYDRSGCTYLGAASHFRLVLIIGSFSGN